MTTCWRACSASRRASRWRALAIGSVAAPILVEQLGVEAAFILAGLTLPVVAAIAFQRIRAVDRDAALADPRDIELLRGTSIFGPLGPANLERVARNLIPIELGEGDVVIREGEPGDRFYVIERGKMHVTRGRADLATLGAGDFFGEIALLRDVPRTATVVAEEPASLRALDREHFLAAVTGSPAGAVSLATEMDRRLAEHDD